MEKFRMVRYRVRVHMKIGGEPATHDLPEPTSMDPWEFRTKAGAEEAAREVAAQYNDGTWCEPYEVEKRIRPLRGHVVLRVLPKPDRTSSGLYLAETRGREDTAEVLACGLDVHEVREGERVCFDPYAVRLVVDADGMDVTNSMHAKAGSLAIVREDAIRYAIG